MGSEFYAYHLPPLDQAGAGGGGLMGEVYGRPAPTGGPAPAGAFALVDDGARQSVVANGPCHGATLRELIARDPRQIIGRKHAGAHALPLLAGFRDCGQREPLQVDPLDDPGTPQEGPAPRGRVWYVVAHRAGAEIVAGLKARYTQQQFVSRAGTAEVSAMVNTFTSQAGDAYYLPPGRVHSLGAGNLVFYVGRQGGTPVTLFDWQNPTPAEQLEPALRHVNFQDRAMARIRGETSLARRNRKLPLVNRCPLFYLDELRLFEEMHDRTDGTSFHLLTAVQGGIVVGAHGVREALPAGWSALIPALPGYYSIAPDGGESRVLRTALNVL